MVRGRGSYSGGGSYSSGRGGSSYRGSSSNYYRSSGSGSTSRGSNSFGTSGYNDSHSRNSYNNSSNYNSYNSKSRDRLSDSRHGDRHDEHNKRPYRTSSRDHSDRKRTRTEDSRVNSNYSSSSSSSYRRNESSRNTRPDPPSMSSSRVSSSYRSSHRGDTSSITRSSNHQHDMGPPKSVPPRSRIVRSSRGIVSSRLRGSLSTRPRILRTRRDADMQIMKKKLMLAHQRDRARRLKIARLTSSLRKRDVTSRHRKTSSSSNRKSRAEKSEENGDTEKATTKSDETSSEKQKTTVSSIKTEKTDDDEDIEMSKEGKVNNQKKGEEDEIESKVKEEKDEKIEEEINDNDGKIAARKTKEKKSESDRKSRSKSPRKSYKRSYIKLTCVHCRTKCLTFQEYSNHLYYRNHKGAMRRLALRQKAQLSQMRLKQRNAQRDIEHNSKEELEDCKPQFCLLCRLNYRQAKAKHQLSEHHRNMKKFLMPYCSTCHIAFKSPMMYEAHRCSLDHIKRKARNNESHSENSDDDEREVDLANFTTVDSVGEIDDIIDEEFDNENIEEKESEKVNVGVDHVKKTEAYYCDLCRMYFPCKDDDAEVLKKHCSTRSHLKSFLRFKENQDLRAEAERVQRKESSKDKRKSTETTEKTIPDDKIKTEENGDENDEGVEDKLWEDVDKDLEFLRDVGPEDDEEDGSVLNIDIQSEKTKNKEMNGVAKTTVDIVDEAMDVDKDELKIKNEEKESNQSVATIEATV